MLEREPNVIIRGILASEWDSTSYGVASNPPISTGWYDLDGGGPMVTVTNAEMGVVNGDVTGVTGSSGDGGISRVYTGTCLVNCWAGTRADCEGIAVGGGNLNPKTVAWRMARHADDILVQQARGTTNAGDPELRSLAPDQPRQLVNTDHEPAVYRYELTARFTFAETTSFS